MQKRLSLQDYVGIARRRAWLIVIPAILGPLIGFGVSSLVSRRYTSQTLVLVEGQKVSDTLVKPAVSEDLDRRLSTMKEQIFSRTSLEPIMQRFGLYKDQAQKKPIDDLLDEMRKNIDVAPIKANGSTPGFFISFTANNPKIAQDVCAEITSMFMEENLKEREQRSVGTTNFLQSQLDEAKRSLDEQDAKLAEFKRKYIGQLPGQEQLNMNMLISLKSQLDAVTQTLERSQQDKVYLLGLLAQQKTSWDASHAGNASKLPSESADAQLVQLKTQLAMLEAKYTPDHPDVLKTKAMIAQIEEAAKPAPGALKQEQTSESRGEAPDKAVREKNVRYPVEVQQMENSVHSLDETLREKTKQQERLQAEIRDYEARIQLSPVVEEQFKALTRDYQNAQNFYQDLLARKSQSEMATDLERKQQGEQFRIVDPANFPEKPSFPDTKKFVGAGAVLGLGFGIALAMLLEFLSNVIRSESDIGMHLKTPVLVMIPDTSFPAVSKKKRDSVNGARLKQRLGLGA